MTSHTIINAGQETTTTGSLLRQTLMTHDECFVYKVPPLATASGYRANEWNLAQPLQTCGFQVERRDNDLYLLFTLENHTKLFAVSKITDGENVQRSVEPVLDSSRYFVTKISQQQQQQQSNNRTALLGFGFRDRDVAIDLLGNLQQFQKSIQRELQAKTMKVTEIPTLKQGDKIHINLPTKGNNNATTTATSSHKPPRKKAATTTTTTITGGGPLLLKKPPPPPPSTDGGAATAAATTTNPTSLLSSPQVPQVVVNLSEMEVPPEPMELDDQGDDHNNNEDVAEASQEDSEGAVAKSIIYDFEDIVDDGLEESGLPKVDNDYKDDDDDDEDFGDFQGA
ncbi:DUF1681 domain containing protein [Nitzschia inconspicua]|uniref:DUF1681 domain containing protein n=1 Tax=Nitzschia inconspicua TaxID=303405 RepID=A0A9K3Q8F6_9STRA|nr:DUF1681 domain containing protein [Nitzschia inconspicua]